MLVKYREELARPLEEAMDFLRRVESQLNTLTNGSARVFSGNQPHKRLEQYFVLLHPSLHHLPDLSR